MIHFTCKECKSPMQLKPTPTGPVFVCTSSKHVRIVPLHNAA